MDAENIGIYYGQKDDIRKCYKKTERDGKRIPSLFLRLDIKK